MSQREFNAWITDVEQALAHPKQIRVLVVEDEQLVGEIYDQVLWAYAVDLVTTLAQARSLLATRPYQVVLLDKNLPDGNGLDLIDAARADRPDIEFIVISGYASIESATRAVALGAFDYLQKPLPHIQVLTRIVQNAAERSLSKRARAALTHELERYQLLSTCLAEDVEEPLGALRAGLVELRELLVPLGPSLRAMSSGALPIDSDAAALRVPRRLTEPERFLDRLGDAVSQVGDRVRQLDRARLHGHPREPRRFEPREAVSAAMRLARVEMAPRTRLEERFEPTPSVTGVVGKLTMSVVDLLLNADAACEGTGRDARIVCRTRSENGRAVVELEDNGCGMNAEVVARMFEPFFTTRRLRETSGIGLALVRQYIEGELGGEIRVSSKPGEGTTVTLHLPAAVSVSMRPPAPPT